jgi:hypothetical protein
MVKAIFMRLEVHVGESMYLNNQAEVNFNHANFGARSSVNLYEPISLRRILMLFRNLLDISSDRFQEIFIQTFYMHSFLPPF